MQGNWKNMVQQQEVMPPTGVWDAIADALDEAEHKPDWQKKMYHASVEPPTDTWQHIAKELDTATDSQQGWQHRMYQYEATPPAETWQMVAEMLDKQDANVGWNARLYNHKIAPPKGVWQHITAQMDAEATPVVPMVQNRVRRLGLLPMAVAAVTVLAVAGTALWLMRDKPADNNPSIAANKDVPAVPQPINTAKADSSNTNMAVVKPAETPATGAQTPIATVAKTTAQKTLPSKKPAAEMAPLEYVTHKEMTFLPADFVFTNTNKLPNEKGQTVVDINGMDTPNSNYINISGPDGQSIRVSAKFANLLGYLNEGTDQEERLDRIIKESAFWKATFRQWREKMTDADAAPSLSNFMGLLEMAKVLQ